MVIEPMPDEFYERYRQSSHEELFGMLGAGSPQQVEELLTGWRSLETTVSALSASLRSDLDRLKETWDGLAGREFDSRVGLIAGYAQTMAAEYGAMHIGLLAMASALAQALGQAEPPDATDTTSGAASTGMTVGSVLGPLGSAVGGVIGGYMGHTKDEHAKEAAKERMVLLTAGLAAEYRVAEYHVWPATVPVPPPNMPANRPVVDADHSHRREEHRDDHDHGHHGHHGSGMGTTFTPPTPMQPQPIQPDTGITASPAVVGAIGAGLVATGVILSGDRDNRGHGHGHGHHDGPIKVSLGDDHVMSDGVVRTSFGVADGDTGGGSVAIGQTADGQPVSAVPGIGGVPGLGVAPVGADIPLNAPDSPGGTPGVVGGTGEITVRDMQTESSLASGGTATGTEGADARGGTTPPPPPPVSGGMNPAAAGTGGVASANPGTVGNVGGPASHTSHTYGAAASFAGHGSGAAGPAGPAGPTGVEARGGEARSWMQEGQMSWRDHVDAAPTVIEEPTSE
jgi:hypothetical protein